MHVIGHQMAFFDLGFLLHRQLVKHFAKMAMQFQIKRSAATLCDEDNVIFAVPGGVA
jgi:hypothetical protein